MCRPYYNEEDGCFEIRFALSEIIYPAMEDCPDELLSLIKGRLTLDHKILQEAADKDFAAKQAEIGRGWARLNKETGSYLAKIRNLEQRLEQATQLQLTTQTELDRVYCLLTTARDYVKDGDTRAAESILLGGL